MARGRELVLLMAVIGMLAAVAVPQYVQQVEIQDITAKENVAGRVRSALVLALADQKAFPSVHTLASYVQADRVTADGSGIIVAVNGNAFEVPTYADKSCATPTASVRDPVMCVGNIP
jgi:type II secretory pathway pseudopilin PulG